MQNAAQEKIIDRLKKLFALGQSSNQHEAELAMQKANEIMTEYQISATDIDLAEDGEVVREEMVVENGKRSTWLCALADACARLYDAKCYYNSKATHGLNLRFYGTPADIMAAKMTFNHLYGSWQSIVKLAVAGYAGSVDTRVFKKSHGMGFTQAISGRVNELVEQRKAKVMSATGRDLVVVKGAAVEKFMEKIKIRSSRVGGNIHQGAASAGLAAGKAIPLHGAIQAEKTLMIGAA